MRANNSILAYMTEALKQWLGSLKHYLLMCLFLSGPDRLPGGWNGIGFSLFAYFFIGLFLVEENRPYSTIAMQIALEIFLLGLVIYAALKWKKLLPRLAQSYSALVGVNLVITVISIPLFNSLADDSTSDGEIDRNILKATLIIVFWNLSVMSLILKRSLNIGTLLAAMISFNYFMLYQFMIIWFFRA